MYARVIHEEELALIPEVVALFAILPEVIYELVAGNHRAYVHYCWWYVFILGIKHFSK